MLDFLPLLWHISRDRDRIRKIKAQSAASKANTAAPPAIKPDSFDKQKAAEKSSTVQGNKFYPSADFDQFLRVLEDLNSPF